MTISTEKTLISTKNMHQHQSIFSLKPQMRAFHEKITLSYSGVTILMAAYFATVLNIGFYSTVCTVFQHLPQVKIGFMLSVPVTFFLAFTLLFNLLSWPYVTKPLFIFLLLLSSVISYASFTYGTIFDTTILSSILETDSAEAGSYCNINAILWITGLGILPSILLATLKLRQSRSWIHMLGGKCAIFLISCTCLVAIAALYFQDYASVGRNNDTLYTRIIPTEFLCSTERIMQQHYFTRPPVFRQIGLDAHQSAQAEKEGKIKPTLVIFVVGETARSYNYAFNGYSRPTNPYTQDLDMISFHDVESCGTATAVSVPCMFSSLDREHFKRSKADSQDNVLDLLNRAGISVLWKENDGGDKDVAKRLPHIDIDRTRVDALCNGSTCRDMVLLENFDKEVQTLHGNRIVLLHIMGSHGPTYYQRYPASMKNFVPDCPRSDIENCSIEEIVNSYDNSLVYTDYVLSEIIKKLTELTDRYNTALLYISDHGESLGEDGIFLHGMPYAIAPKYQTHVPLLLWMSEEFKNEKHINTQCLNTHAHNGHYSQDNIFHSLLGIMDVETSVYDASKDIFAPCRTPPSAP